MKTTAIVGPLLSMYSMSTAADGNDRSLTSSERGWPMPESSANGDSEDPAQFAAVLLPALVFTVREGAIVVAIDDPHRLIAVLATIGVVVSGTRERRVAAGSACSCLWSRSSQLAERIAHGPQPS